MKKKAIIIANGYLPKKRLILKLKKLGFEDIFCADGGANNLNKLKINPLYIIGDLDSIKPEVLNFYSLSKVNIIKDYNQDNTDIEKVLDFLIQNNYSEAVIFGATGDRLDHTIGNISIILKYYNKIKLFLLHYNSLLTVCNKNVIFNAELNETISFYGVSSKSVFTTKGLMYNLNNELLFLGYRESTSNVAINNTVTINCSDKFILIRDFYKAVTNGFLK